MKCPYCDNEMDCDEIDNGVGMQKCGPYGCGQCHAVEINPDKFNDPTLDADERRTGFYKGDHKW